MGVVATLAVAAVLAGAAPRQQAGPPAPAQPEARAPVVDGRRTTARFVVNLGRNVVGIFSPSNLRPFALGAAAPGASSLLDDDVRSYFAPERRARWLGDAVDLEGQPRIIGSVGIALFIAGRFSRPQRFRDATYDVAQALLVDTTYVFALKQASQRQRPDGSNNLSFPSGHTSNAFAWATVAAHYYGPKLAVPAYLFAGLVGVGRLEKNAHYLSDVFAGAALGVLVGRTVVRKDATPLGRAPRVAMQPAHDAHGAGIGFAVRVEF
jgi:membrane-associated phospholipid phosphatase